MSKQYETGHAKNVANLKKLIEQVTVFPEYNPSVANLALESLNTLHTQALDHVSQVEVKRIAYKNATHARQQAYEPLKPNTTRIINHLELLNLPAGTQAQAKSLVKSIRGDKIPKKMEANNTEDTPSTISTSRQSYTQLAENFSKLLQLLTTISIYTPNTEDLKLPNLNTYYTQLVNTTQTVDQAEAALNNAIIERDKFLYADATGLYTIAQNVKKYIKSHYGSTSHQYEKVVKISFTSP